MIDGIKMLLKDSSFEIIGEVNHPHALAAEIHRTRPDILLLDLNMGGKNMVDQITSFKKITNQLKIVIFSSYNSPSLVKDAFLQGADAYVLKDTTREELLTALQVVLDNETYVGQSVHYFFAATDDRIDQRLRDEFSQLAELSDRELEIIQQIVQGKTSREIGNLLFISKHTVQTHRKNILRKLSLHSGADIIRFAYKTGINA